MGINARDPGYRLFICFTPPRGLKPLFAIVYSNQEVRSYTLFFGYDLPRGPESLVVFV